MSAFEKLKDKLKKDIVSSFISEGLTLGDWQHIMSQKKGIQQ